jgi:hypothetical protein
MAGFKSRVEQLASGILRKTGVPEQQIPARMKSVGQYMILLGTVMIVPLVLLDKVPTAAVIVLQLLYATLMCIGVILAVKEKK